MDQFNGTSRIGLDAEPLSVLCTFAGVPFALRDDLFRAHWILGLLGLGFLNEVIDPAHFITLALVTEAVIDAHHLAEQFALGAPLLPGEEFHLPYDRRRHREADHLCYPAHDI